MNPSIGGMLWFSFFWLALAAALIWVVAQGEVVIVNDRYGIRLTDIVTPAERLRKINR